MDIAEILKDCPKGTKLYSPTFGEVELVSTEDDCICVKTDNDHKQGFFSDGKYSDDGECMLFPSKENRDWSSFKSSVNHKHFKTGDYVLIPYICGDIRKWRLATYSHWDNDLKVHITDCGYWGDDEIISYHDNGSLVGKPVEE